MIQLQEIVGLPSLQYHLDNNLSLHENVYRYNSEAFIQLFKEAREALSNEEIELDEEDRELLETTDIGEYADYNGMRVPLDLPMMSKKYNPLFEIGSLIDEMIENEDTIDEATSISEMVDFELVKELVESIGGTIDMDKLKQAYITHTTDNYEQITINLVNSISSFSDKPIVVYTIDYTATEALKSIATCIRLDLELPKLSGDDFLGDGIKYVNRSTYRTYKALSSKIDCMLHACDFIEEWVYLDGDCIANHNVDDLFDWCTSADEYPLATKGPQQYVLLVRDGELIGNPFIDDTANEQTKDNTKCLEWPLMDYFGMDVNQRSTQYRTTNILAGSNKNKEFLETWRMHKEVLPTKVDPVKFMPFHEETIYNVLVWQRTDRGLPMVYINVEGPETVDHFFNTITKSDVLVSEFYKLPQHKKNIKVLKNKKIEIFILFHRIARPSKRYFLRYYPADLLFCFNRLYYETIFKESGV